MLRPARRATGSFRQVRLDKERDATVIFKVVPSWQCAHFLIASMANVGVRFVPVVLPRTCVNRGRGEGGGDVCVDEMLFHALSTSGPGGHSPHLLLSVAPSPLHSRRLFTAVSPIHFKPDSLPSPTDLTGLSESEVNDEVGGGVEGRGVLSVSIQELKSFYNKQTAYTYSLSASQVEVLNKAVNKYCFATIASWFRDLNIRRRCRPSPARPRPITSLVLRRS